MVPADVSLICMTYDVMPVWYRPLIANFKSDEGAFLRRITDWVNAVASGGGDSLHIVYPSDFVPGESIAPVRLRGSGVVGW